MKILTCLPRQLTKQQKDKLADEGIMVIETDNPESINIIDTSTIISSSDLLLPALEAIASYGISQVSHSFVVKLVSKLQKSKP